MKLERLIVAPPFLIRCILMREKILTGAAKGQVLTSHRPARRPRIAHECNGSVGLSMAPELRQDQKNREKSLMAEGQNKKQIGKNMKPC